MSDPTPKAKPGASALSQHGEDLWLLGRFSRQSGGYGADVGANDGFLISNTFLLEERGWDILCVEPNPMFHDNLRGNRKTVATVACGSQDLDGQEMTIYGDGSLGGFLAGSSLHPDARLIATVDGLKPFTTFKVCVRRLDGLLEQCQFPRCDFVSIDTEGTEADVLLGFDLARWKTQVVVIENNFDEDDKARELLRAADFRRVFRLGVNDFWEKK